jgi:hypothetical protein
MKIDYEITKEWIEMTIHDRWVGFGIVLKTNGETLKLDSNVINSNEIFWCFRCGCLLFANAKEKHEKFHKEIDTILDMYEQK